MEKGHITGGVDGSNGGGDGHSTSGGGVSIGVVMMVNLISCAFSSMIIFERSVLLRRSVRSWGNHPRFAMACLLEIGCTYDWDYA